MNILNKKCCDNTAGLAFEIKESLRKGMYTNNRMPKEIENLLSDCGASDRYIGSMKKNMYLPSKAYIIMLLKKEFAKYLKIV